MRYLDRKSMEIAKTLTATLRESLAGAGLTASDPFSSPYADDQGDAGACIVIERGGEPVADVRVEIPCANGIEGRDEHERSLGWGFGFGCTLVSGEIGPGGTMFNFSEHVWTRDRREIRSRLLMLRSGVGEYAMEIDHYLREQVTAAS